jgi:hypothetical protein
MRRPTFSAFRNSSGTVGPAIDHIAPEDFHYSW